MQTARHCWLSSSSTGFSDFVPEDIAYRLGNSLVCTRGSFQRARAGQQIASPGPRDQLFVHHGLAQVGVEQQHSGFALERQRSGSVLHSPE